MRFVIEIPDELVARGAAAPVAATSAVAPLPGSLSGGAAPQRADGSTNGARAASDAGPAGGGAAALFARSAASLAQDALDGGGAPARATPTRGR